MIETLLNHGALINAPDERGFTPVHIASELHRVQALEQLLVFIPADIPPQPQANPNAEAFDNETTPLDLAMRGHSSSFITAEEVAEKLLLASADVNHAGRQGLTALHHAARARNVRLVNLLLSFGANCQLRAPDGKTPIHYAVGEVLRDNNGSSILPLHSRAVEDPSSVEVEILSAFLSSLSDNQRASVIGKDGSELLSLAVARSAAPAAGFLLKHGAITDQGGIANYSILKVAASHGSREIVRLVLRDAINRPALGNAGHASTEYDKFLQLAEAFLDDSPGSAMVREECAIIYGENGLRERLSQLATERGFIRLASFWADQMGIGYCSPASIFHRSIF